MNVIMGTSSDPEGLVTGIALYGAICNFRTDSRFQVTNEYLLVNKLLIS